MEMKQNVSESETVLSYKQNIFSDSSTQTKKKIFRFPDPNKKKYFQIPATQTKSLQLFSAGRLFRQQKVGHGNETKCFGVRNSSFIQTKKYFFSFFDPTKKKIFGSRSNKKKNF